jgi:PAS domain S-box-containing protein
MATVEGVGHIVRYINPAFCRLLHQTREQLIGKPLPGLLPKKDKCVTWFNQVLRTGNPASFRGKAPSKPPLVVWSYVIWPLLADEALAGIMIQVTETIEVREAMVSMNEALVLGSLRQHELTQIAQNLNEQLWKEITVRLKTAAALAEKARLLDLTHDAIIVRGLDGRISYWSHGAEKLYRTEWWTGEMVHTKRDGQRITVLVRMILDRDVDGNPASILKNITDITERKQAEEALREAGERFRFMAESMPQKIFTAKPDGGVQYLNQQWTEFTGLSLEEMRGWGWKLSFHPDDVVESKRRWKQAVGTGEPFEFEHRLRDKHGGYRWHLTRAYAMKNTEGNITMWVGSNTDIHDMVNVREKLRAAQAQLADRAVQLEGIVASRTAELTAAHGQLLAEADERRRLESEIAGAIEGERERLGQELHDGLVQELTGIAMMLYVMERKLLEPAPEQAAEAHRLTLMLQQSHRNARDLAKSFYPIELEQQGLAAALEGIAQRAQEQSGVKCTVDAGTIVETGVKDAASVQLLRIAQEAVQNAVKHAHAREIVIHLSKLEGSWLLTVQDDGKGLRLKRPDKNSMGLRIMEYRARIINGSLSVGNAADGGVLVSCSVPAGEPR